MRLVYLFGAMGVIQIITGFWLEDEGRLWVLYISFIGLGLSFLASLLAAHKSREREKLEIFIRGGDGKARDFEHHANSTGVAAFLAAWIVMVPGACTMAWFFSMKEAGGLLTGLAVGLAFFWFMSILKMGGEVSNTHHWRVHEPGTGTRSRYYGPATEAQVFMHQHGKEEWEREKRSRRSFVYTIFMCFFIFFALFPGYKSQMPFLQFTGFGLIAALVLVLLISYLVTRFGD